MRLLKLRCHTSRRGGAAEALLPPRGGPLSAKRYRAGDTRRRIAVAAAAEYSPLGVINPVKRDHTGAPPRPLGPEKNRGQRVASKGPFPALNGSPRSR